MDARTRPGTALSYLSSPLDDDTAVIGAGALQVWVRSAARNVDLQATITEVRPDGKETFVQGGWLRTGARKLDRQRRAPCSSRCRASASATRRRCPRGAGSRSRSRSTTRGTSTARARGSGSSSRRPAGDQPTWAFAEAKPNGTPWVAVAHSRELASRLVLPVVGGIEPPAAYPPCPGLRGQPCRDYLPLDNPGFHER